MADEGEQGGAGTATAEGDGAEGQQEGQEGTQEGQGAAEGQEGEGQQQGAGKGQQQGARSRGDQRIQQLANDLREAKQQLQQAHGKITELSTPAEARAAAEKAKEEAKRFYQDPAAYVQQTREELRQEMTRVVAQQQDVARYQSGLETLRSSPGFNNELEQAMVKAIERHGLRTPEKIREHGKFGVLKLAYEVVTGKEWGHWTQDGYNTRKTKERLSRPGSGGGMEQGRRGATMSPEQYDAAMLELSKKQMDPDEQSREMEKLGAALDAWAAAQG